jgi:hypothetical protein
VVGCGGFVAKEASDHFDLFGSKPAAHGPVVPGTGDTTNREDRVIIREGKYGGTMETGIDGRGERNNNAGVTIQGNSGDVDVRIYQNQGDRGEGKALKQSRTETRDTTDVRSGSETVIDLSEVPPVRRGTTTIVEQQRRWNVPEINAQDEFGNAIFENGDGSTTLITEDPDNYLPNAVGNGRRIIIRNHDRHYGRIIDRHRPIIIGRGYPPVIIGDFHCRRGDRVYRNGDVIIVERGGVIVYRRDTRAEVALRLLEILIDAHRYPNGLFFRF